MATLWESLRPRFGVLTLNRRADESPYIINGKLSDELINDPRYENDIEVLQLTSLNSLNIIDKFPNNLKVIKITNCKNIENLTNVPPSVVTLEIMEMNNLTFINNLTQLKHLSIKYCSNLQLPNFEIFQDLIELILDRVNIINLPSLPPRLIKFMLNDCNIQQLPSLSINSLKIIIIENNPLEELPDLPESLEKLICRRCNLKRLPNLPETLTILHLENNQLTELPELPDGLIELYVDNNRLTSLPSPLSRSLQSLHFNNNMVTIVPEIPNTLEEIIGINNPITQLPPNLQGNPRIYTVFDDNINISNRLSTPPNNTLSIINPPEPPPSIQNNSTTTYPPPPNYPTHSQYPLVSKNPKKFKLTDITYDAINNEEITIQDYFNQEDANENQNFILHLNGRYICQSIDGVKRSNSEESRPTDYAEYYECHKDTKPEWLGNTYIRDWLKKNGRGPFVKIMGPGGSKYLVDKPSFFWNGPVPGSKVFNMVKTRKKVKKYVSSYILPVRPDFDAMGADHCNQTRPETLYRLELMEVETESPEIVEKNKRKTKKHRNRKLKKRSERKTKKNTSIAEVTGGKKRTNKNKK